MRKYFGWLLTAGLICCAQNSAQAQTNEGIFPRLRNLFSPKTKTDDGAMKTETPKEARPTPTVAKQPSATTIGESDGIVDVEEPSRPSFTTTFPPGAAIKNTTGIAAPNKVNSVTNAAVPLQATPAKATSATPSATTAIPKFNAPVTPSNTPPLTTAAQAQKLSQKISQACPLASNIRVAFPGGNEVTVEMTVRNVDECNTLAMQIFNVRELDSYKLNLKFQVP